MRTFAKSLAAGVLIVLVTFLVTLVLSRVLEYGDFSAYMFMLSVVTLASVPVKLGVPAFSLRETARHEASGEHGRIVSVWTWSLAVMALNAAVVLAAAGLVLRYVLDDVQEGLGLFLLAIPFLALIEFLGFTLRGLRHISTGQLVASAFANLVTISVLLAAAALGEVSLRDAIAIHVLSLAFACLVSGILLKGRAARILRSAGTAGLGNRVWFGSVLTLGAISAIQVFNKNADILVIGSLGHLDYVGVYKVAIQLSVLISFILGITNNITAVYVSKLYFSDRRTEMQAVLSLNVLVIFAVSASILAVVLLFGERIVLVLYGEDFARALLPFLVLSIGQFIAAIFGPVGMILNMTGHEGRAVRVTFPAMLLNLAALVPMILLFGPVAAAFVNAGFMLGLNLMLLRLNRRLVGADPSVFFALGSLLAAGERRDALVRTAGVILRSRTL